jgi:hypothetical protein
MEFGDRFDPALTFNVRFQFSQCFFRIHKIDKKYSIIDNLHKISDLLADGSNNAFITDSEYLSYLEKSSNESKKFTKLDEKILSNHWGFEFMKNTFIFKAFNRKVVQLVEAGIADLIVKDETSVNHRSSDDEPEKLSLDHLGVWFNIWLVLLTAAALCFLVEFVVSRCRGSASKVSIIEINKNRITFTK